ncbi:DUF5709 domain-containing protein [Streptomyces sp. NPDC053431]|uniref:DUF5709 domain-containing protein n=1 Tax=Streptomyces sp. NPDC053431 TaxID=3365703 RepID=UPI0037D51D08
MPENTSQAPAPEPAAPSDGEGRGDEVYQPAGSDAANRPSGPYDPENALPAETTEDPEEPGYSPPDRPRAVTGHGTTVREAHEGASLDDRLAEERPDADAGARADDDGVGDLPGGEGEPLDQEAGAQRAGRLVRPSDLPASGSVTATDVGPDDGTAPAEEAAVHRDTGIDEAG